VVVVIVVVVVAVVKVITVKLAVTLANYSLLKWLGLVTLSQPVVVPGAPLGSNVVHYTLEEAKKTCNTKYSDKSSLKNP